MTITGGVKINVRKLEEIKTVLQEISKECNNIASGMLSDTNKCKLWWEIEKISLQHDHYLSADEIVKDVQSSVISARDRIDSLLHKIDYTIGKYNEWENGTNNQFDASANVMTARVINSLIESTNPSIKIKVMDSNGNVKYYTTLEYRTEFGKLTRSKITSNGATNNSVDSNSIKNGSTTGAILGSVVASPYVYNSNVTNNKVSSPSSNVVDNNKNNNVDKIESPSKVDDNKNSSSNDDTNSSIINKDPISDNIDNSSNVNNVVDTGTNSNISNNNGNSSSSNNSSSIGDEKNNKNNNQGFGSIFNKNDDYKAPDISTSVVDVPNNNNNNSNSNDSLPLDSDNVSTSKPGDFGNLFDNDNISSSGTGTYDNNGSSTSKSSGFNPIPLGVGLGLATAVGVGAKVIHDHKKNSEFNDDDQVESFGGNKFWSDDDLSVVHSEEDSFTDDNLERFNSTGESDLSSSYSAAYTNDVESQVPDNNLWTLEDEDLKNNEQIVDLLNGN